MKYDVVIIGGGHNGLTAAAYLAAAGRRVLVLERRQVGQATSHTWSPLLKKYLAIASIRDGHEAKGTKLQIEHTVEYERRKVTATVAQLPFFDPERKRKP